MSSYKYCNNCLTKIDGDCMPDFCGALLYLWQPIPCPHCGGILSEIRVHKGKKLRHCYSCNFDFYEESEQC